jgi:hypothetical protein
MLPLNISDKLLASISGARSTPASESAWLDSHQTDASRIADAWNKLS